MPAESCSSCRFWKPALGANPPPTMPTPPGFCRRHAKVVVTWTDISAVTGAPIVNSGFDWPTTASNDWCGDWERPKAPEE